MSGPYKLPLVASEVARALNMALTSVQTTEQSFTDGQKAQSRDNINTGPGIVPEASGNMIVLNDSTDQKIRGLKIYGKSTQDGTPTPEAPVELVSAGASGSIGVAVVGKNLIDPEGITPSGNTNIHVWLEKGKILPPGTYTMQYMKSPDKFLNGIYVRKHKSNETIKAAYGVNVLTFELDKATSVSLDFYMADGLPSLDADSIMLEFGSIATVYEPYKPIQTLTAVTPDGLPGIPVSSGGNYTDENGQQWICDEIDFAKGVHVKRLAFVDMGTLEWQYDENENRFYAIMPNDARKPTELVRTTDITLCSVYYASDTASDKTYFIYSNSSLGVRIYVYDESYTDVSTFKSAMSDAMLLYELATPIEIHIPEEELAEYRALHTNKPNTTVYNDAGAGMEVEYVADTKIYIDNKFAELAAAIVNNA